MNHTGSRTPSAFVGAAIGAAALLLSHAVASYPAPQDDPDSTDRGPGDHGKTARASRRVRFAIVPAGARLTLDGREVSWFGATFALGLGAHRASVEVPGSKCCRRFSGAVTIAPPPDGKWESPQVVQIRLELLPARVTLVNAPPGARLVCPALGLGSTGGRLQEVRLPEARWSGSCEFMAAGAARPRTKTVSLDAGELNAIEWP